MNSSQVSSGNSMAQRSRINESGFVKSTFLENGLGHTIFSAVQ